MARKKSTRRKPATEPLASVAASADIRVITIKPGGTLKMIVDVGPMAIPYTVQYAGRTVIKSLVDRAEDVVPLFPGDRVLGWAFTHIVKGWHHRIGYSIDGGATAVVLESRSEADKDTDHSIGVAIVRVEADRPR